MLDVFRAQRELMTTYAPGKPTFQWIETSKMTGECASLQITPAIVNAETWLAITGGACGIGFFTNSWTSDVWDRWSFDPGIEQQLASDGLARAEACARALRRLRQRRRAVGRRRRGEHPHAERRAVRPRRELHRRRATTVPFRVDALAGRTLTVLDEGRTIRPAKKVFFRDRFAPYEVHVYVAAPKG